MKEHRREGRLDGGPSPAPHPDLSGTQTPAASSASGHSAPQAHFRRKLYYETSQLTCPTERRQAGKLKSAGDPKPHFSSISDPSAINTLYLRSGKEIGFMDLDEALTCLGLGSSLTSGEATGRPRWSLPELQLPAHPGLGLATFPGADQVGKGHRSQSPVD